MSYRFAAAEDGPAIIRLWEEETEWGIFPFADSERWLGSPGGMPRTVLAVEDATGDVLGQFGFVPTLIYANGRLLRGARPHSTIVGARLRDMVSSWNPADQPAFAMYRYGLTQLKAEGVQLVHMIPNPRWVALIRIFPGMQRAQFPLWSIPFPLPASFSMPAGCTAGSLGDWRDEVDRLWEAAAPQYACGVVRDAHMFEWKTSLEGSAVIAVRKDAELIGLVSARMKGDRQWTISDMLTLNSGEALRATVAAAVLAGAEHASSNPGPGPDHRPVKAAILATPLMLPVLADSGFAPDTYKFSFVVQILDASLDSKELDPKGWYLAATD